MPTNSLRLSFWTCVHYLLLVCTFQTKSSYRQDGGRVHLKQILFWTKLKDPRCLEKCQVMTCDSSELLNPEKGLQSCSTQMKQVQTAVWTGSHILPWDMFSAY